MKEMKECISILDEMVKGMSFDPNKPIVMTPQAPYYNPYGFVAGENGGFMPYNSKHWGTKAPIDNPTFNSYWENDKYLRDHGIMKSKDAVGKKISKLKDEGKPQDQAVAIALDMERRGDLSKKSLEECLNDIIKGGPGSGRHKGVDNETDWSASGLSGHPRSGESDKRMTRQRMMEIMNKKDKEREEKEKKDKESKKIEEKQNPLRNLFFNRSEEMEKDIFKSLGISTEERSLIEHVDENQEVAKSIENNDFHLDGRLDTEARNTVQQLHFAKSYGSENLKNTHAEDKHKDNDKKVKKMVEEVGEIKADEEPETRKFDKKFASISATLDDLIKGEKKEAKAKEKMAEAVDDMIDEEVDEHEEEMHKKSLVNEAFDWIMKAEEEMEEGSESEESEPEESEEEGDEAEQEALKEVKDEMSVGAGKGAAEEMME